MPHAIFIHLYFARLGLEGSHLGGGSWWLAGDVHPSLLLGED